MSDETTMLTADDVRDIIEHHSDEAGGNGRDFYNGAYEAIADELNAALGKQGYYTDRDDEGTHIMCDRCGGYIGTAEEIAATLGRGECELVYGETDRGVDSWFTQCGGRFTATFEDGRMVHPKFCQLCGSKAVKR